VPRTGTVAVLWRALTENDQIENIIQRFQYEDVHVDKDDDRVLRQQKGLEFEELLLSAASLGTRRLLLDRGATG
jgi:hypothetical protein